MSAPRAPSDTPLDPGEDEERKTTKRARKRPKMPQNAVIEDDDDAADAGNQKGRVRDEERKSRRGGSAIAPRRTPFSKPLRLLMYGCGDDEDPSLATANVLEDYVTQYVSDLTRQASGLRPNWGAEELAFLVRHDRKRVVRIQELLRFTEELKEARILFPEAETARVRGNDAPT